MMFLDRSVSVPEGVYKQQRGDKIYVYVSLMEISQEESGAYRSKCCRRMVGRIIPGTDGRLMYPNENYYELYDQAGPESSPEYSTEAENGAPQQHKTEPAFAAVCRLALQRTGLEQQLLQDYFDSVAGQLALLACHYAAGEQDYSTIDLTAEWNNVWPQARLFAQEDVPQLLSEAGCAPLRSFMADWTARTAPDDDLLVFEVSAVAGSIYMKRADAELFYEGCEPPPNFVLFCSQHTGMPLFFTSYSGSLNNPKTVKRIIALARERGLKGHITLALEAGTAGLKDMHSLQSAGAHFVCGVTEAIKEVVDLLEDFFYKWPLSLRRRIYHQSRAGE